MTSVVDAPRPVSSDASPTRPEWAVSRASMPAAAAAAVNRRQIECGDRSNTWALGSASSGRNRRRWNELPATRLRPSTSEASKYRAEALGLRSPASRRGEAGSERSGRGVEVGREPDGWEPGASPRGALVIHGTRTPTNHGSWVFCRAATLVAMGPRCGNLWTPPPTGFPRGGAPAVSTGSGP